MRKKAINRIWTLAVVLFCANLLCLWCVSRTYARYTSEVTASASAPIAAWDVEVTGTSLTETDIIAGLSSYTSGEYLTYGIISDVPDSNGYLRSGYRFTVETGEATDTAGALSVRVSVSQNDKEEWPAGLTAALYSVTGASGSESYTLVSQSTSGSFENVKTVAQDTAFTGNYLVCFKSEASTVAGEYQISVEASMNQVD